MITILGKSSSINVRKVLWLCAELDLAHAHEQWGSGHRSTQEAQFLALNPNAMVPVLLDDGFVLWESNSICRYLATRQRRVDLLPAEPRARALVEQWMDWQATELNNAWRYAFMGLVRNSAEHQDAVLLVRGIEGWNRHMAILERQLLATQAYAAGAQFTLADIVLGLSVQRWMAAPLERFGGRPELPAVRAYHARLCQRAGFLRHGANGMP
ncbi:Glutathione S-transferase GstB [Delftia tsuruhatensis]|uniref:glutathione S-transferase family protein n=1 Tax=Delftia tsuruhatensis TaxID=180282 RepID=UPI001E798BBE|nr:glutathione S-transferase [Delftia tsuruhatensis]CAB5722633.1 Glutathione S-transferase GstB [Delftia tsuruhatensis]CAC9680956.1 Glutathione S-transferase GstB [Delftia tsuruhatensis]